MKTILYILVFVGASYMLYLLCRWTELAMGTLERRSDPARSSPTDAFVYRALYALLHVFTVIAFVFILPMAIYSFQARLEDKAFRAAQSSSFTNTRASVSSAPSMVKSIFAVCLILLAFFVGYKLSSIQHPVEVEHQSSALSSAPSKTKDNTLVYISKYGQCYHSLPSCGGMTDTSKVTVSEAESLGRRPCEVCYK